MNIIFLIIGIFIGYYIDKNRIETKVAKYQKKANKQIKKIKGFGIETIKFK